MSGPVLFGLWLSVVLLVVGVTIVGGWWFGERLPERKREALLPTQMRKQSATELARRFTAAELDAAYNAINRTCGPPRVLKNAISIRAAEDALDKVAVR